MLDSMLQNEVQHQAAEIDILQQQITELRTAMMSLANIGASFDELVVAAGLQKETAPQRLTPHSLRHTYASWLAIAGVSLRRIQELLGHKSITTTERYSHLGHNGQHPYYFELARCCSNGFVPRFVTSPLRRLSQILVSC
jgi:site-specific recombinase XerD